MSSVSGLRVLDLVCCLGLTNAYFHTSRGCQPISIDIFEEFLKANTLDAVTAGIHVDYVVGNAESLPQCLNGAFDLVNDLGA